jgi:hypothetical protein
MKVQELVQELEQFDPDAEVRLAFQPSWPLQYHVGGVAEDGGHVHTVDIHEDEDGREYFCTDEDCPTGETWDEEPRDWQLGRADGPKVVYVAEAGQVSDAPYLPGSASTALGWR